MHRRRELNTHAVGRRPEVQHMRQDSRRSRFKKTSRIRREAAHLGPDHEPAVVPDPRARLVGTSYPFKFMIITVEPPRRSAVVRLQGPVIKSPGPADERQRVSGAEDVASCKGTGEQVDVVDRLLYCLCYCECCGDERQPHGACGAHREGRLAARRADARIPRGYRPRETSAAETERLEDLGTKSGRRFSRCASVA